MHGINIQRITVTALILTATLHFPQGFSEAGQDANSPLHKGQSSTIITAVTGKSIGVGS
jgi:hypothetical protein